MFVENPHYLCGIHCRTAAEGDNCIGFESRHLCRTALCIFESGVGLNVKECCMSNAHFIKFVGNGLCVAVFIEECICYDKRFLGTPHRSEFVKSNRKTTFFNINLFGCAEPKHIFPSFCNCFDIDKMLYANIFRNRVTAPGTASEGE